LHVESTQKDKEKDKNTLEAGATRPEWVVVRPRVQNIVEMHCF